METKKRVAAAGLFVALPVFCIWCIAPALVIAAGVGLASWIGGIAVGAVVLAGGIVFVALRGQSAKARGILGPVGHDCCAPAPASDEVAAPAAESGTGRRPFVEVLYFDGCPNHEPALALVERIGRELGIEPQIQLVNVPDQEAAQRLRFLGSPTVRIGGRDVDPHAEERRDYGFSCRVFRTEAGVVGQPDARWVRDALIRASTGRTP